MRTARYYYEEELDEMLLVTNPNGGKPKEVGATVWLGSEEEGSVCDVKKVQEDSSRRFMLGYCTCGRKVVIGTKRAEVLSEALRRNGIAAKVPVVPMRLRFARLLARGIKPS